MSHEHFTRRDQAEFVGQVPGTRPTNFNQFESFALVAGTKFWSQRLQFLTKMGSSHEGTWSPGLLPLCMCVQTFIFVCNLPTFGASAKMALLETAVLAKCKATASTPFKSLLASAAMESYKKKGEENQLQIKHHLP